MSTTSLMGDKIVLRFSSFLNVYPWKYVENTFMENLYHLLIISNVISLVEVVLLMSTFSQPSILSNIFANTHLCVSHSAHGYTVKK